jgi:uncharacterized membrane protein
LSESDDAVGARAGTAAQALGIAERLGGGHRVVPLEWGGLARLPLPVPTLAGLRDRAGFAPPWPRLAISAGRRSAPVARWLAEQGVTLINLSLGLLVPLLGILLIGLMARNIVGRWLLEFGEGTLLRIPLAGSVYKTLKQLLETFLRDNSTRFRRVVLVEYPREGLFAVGFVTGVLGSSIQSDFQETMLSVFIPTAPNPTTGWYAVVPERSVRDIDLSVEDAFRTIISAGIVSPDDRETPSNRSFSSLIAQLRAPQLS